MSDVVQALEAKVLQIEEELRSAKRDLHNARVAAGPISIGDVVRNKRNGKLGRVIDIDTRFGWRNPCVVVNPQKKNGEFGIVERRWYYWEPTHD